MTAYHNDYSDLRSGPILREAGVGGSNPLTPTNEINNLPDRKVSMVTVDPVSSSQWLFR